MTQKLVEEVIQEVAGGDVLPLVKALKNKKNVSEFVLATSIKREINTTRNMLYKLYDANLVSFTRKKDKTKGWYIYYWTFNGDKTKHVLRDIKKTKLEKLNERLTREQGSHFYACPSSCIRLDFEQSVDYEYKCPECGSLLHMEDNTKKIEEIKKTIQGLEKDLNIGNSK